MTIKERTIRLRVSISQKAKELAETDPELSRYLNNVVIELSEIRLQLLDEALKNNIHGKDLANMI